MNADALVRGTTARPCRRGRGSTARARSAPRRPGAARGTTASWSTSTSDRPIARTFPASLQLGERSPRVQQRHGRVEPVQQVQVDDVDAQSSQRCVAGLPHVLGASVAHHGARLDLDRTALGADAQLVTAGRDGGVGQRAPDELLVGERPVHVGGVEERDPEIDRSMDDGDRARRRRARSACTSTTCPCTPGRSPRRPCRRSCASASRHPNGARDEHLRRR